MPVGGILTTGACARARACVVGDLAEPQIVGGDGAPFGQQHRPLDRVLELADVARPVVAHQQLLRVRLEPVDLLLQLAGEPADEELASGTMSSLRSRSGGISIETTFRR